MDISLCYVNTLNSYNWLSYGLQVTSAKKLFPNESSECSSNTYHDRVLFDISRVDPQRSPRGAKRTRPCSTVTTNRFSFFLASRLERNRHRAVNAPLHPAEKEPQRIRHLAVLLTCVRKN